MTLFNIILYFDEKKSDSFFFRRSLKHLQGFYDELHYSDLELPQEFEDSAVILFNGAEIPAHDHIDHQNLVVVAADVQKFLQICFKSNDIAKSEAMESFLWDPLFDEIVSIKSELHAVANITPISLILQPFEKENRYIPKRNSFFVDFKIEKQSTLVWQFFVNGGGCDIEFGVIYRPFTNQKQWPVNSSHDKTTQVC